MTLLFFFAEFLLLFFLSRELTKYLSHFFYFVFRRQSVAIHILSFLFLPGVVLHELSHLLVASVLFVPTGEVEFFPEIHGNEVKMGSVAIAKTDPLRRFLIGVAPILGGLFVLFVSFWYLSFDLAVVWRGALLLYIVFQIGNTMFSSRKDMEGAVGVGGVSMLIGIILSVLGVPVWSFIVNIFQNKILTEVLEQMNWFLIIAIAVDALLLSASMGTIRLFRRRI